MILELSVDSLPCARVADTIGADRVELCAAGSEGGLTPSIGTVRAAARVCRSAGVHVLVRPRGGEFVYTAAEIDAMAEDIATCAEAGADGIVTGVLRADGRLDRAALAALHAAAQGREFTFHRAIDVCAEPHRALDSLAELGVTRVLTSGGADRAEDGAERIAAFVAQAGTAVQILACGGVRTHNARAIAERTGVSQLHAAPRRPRPPAMADTGTRVSFALAPDGADRYELDADTAAELRAVLR
ncbi:copper homeostasis protein CutC [Sciscionella sediminilitoris]|uniref:copper homeostasis protein CutC n=1 Tax=Sciscionella sediminilitoris TaxID=1445613 RepID=UPI0004DF1DE7|nr:copper homeostasis protein CutC [Sciscionella sp. SE31]